MCKYTTLKLLWIGIVAMLFLAILCSGSIQQKNECSFINELGLKEKVNCGVLTVPENHNNLKEKQINLTYVIIKSKKASNDAYPLIYLIGEPGGKTLTRRTINRFINSPYRDNRDIILFDQRGVGFSSALPNMNNEVFRIMSKDITQVEESHEMSKLLASIKDEIKSNGSSLAYYNTYQNAKDVGSIMEALGYEKYNIIGGSYGTTLGRVVQDYYPNKLHSIIHNAPSPLKMDFLISRLKSYELAIERLFNWCENDAKCSSNYPNLKSTYIEVINVLKSSPIHVDTDNFRFTINAQDGLYLIRRLLYLNNSKELVPRLINALKTEEFGLLQNVIEFEKRYNENLNFSMHLAVSSYEQIEPYATSSYIDSTYTASDLFPTKLGFFDAFYQSGKDWQKQKASGIDKQFKKSNVPTLVMVNYYDPVTPPKNGHLFKKDLPNGQLLVLDEGGHGSVSNPECQTAFFKSFMDNPKAKLKTSCFNLYVE